MKKAIICLLALALLTGCAAEPGRSGDSQTQLAPPPVAAVPMENLRYRVETETVSGSLKGDDDAVLYNYEYSLPRLTAQTTDGQPVDDAVTQAFNREFDAWRSSEAHAETLQTAQAEYDWRMQEGMLEDAPWVAYTEAFSYTLYQTDRLVSVEAQFYFYSGGAHPNTAYSAWNFDLEKGEFIPVDFISADGESFVNAVTQELLRQMEARAKEYDTPADGLYFRDYADIAAQWFHYAVSFTKAGMAVTFSPYDLAPYAAGAQVFELSYEFLQPYLSDYGKALLQVSKEK